MSYQNDDSHESNVDEKLVEVSEDVPLEGGDGGQEAAEEDQMVGQKKTKPTLFRLQGANTEPHVATPPHPQKDLIFF